MKRIVVGVLAHVDSGKTTLTEALMYKSGNIRKLGRVDNGDSFLDTFSLERSRGITIFSKQAVLPYKDAEFTLVDTPGHIDFSAETERTLQVLDYAILVVSGSEGVQSHTKTLWKLLARYNVPVFLFINKMDLEGADKGIAMAKLKTKLSDNCVDFGSVDDFYENIALCDDELFLKYEEEKLNKQDIIEGIRSRKIFPCMFGSALKLEGVTDFLDTLYSYTEMPNYGDDFGGKVYKISEDKGQRLTFLKVTGGTLRVKEVLNCNKNLNKEKINQIRIYSGEKFTTVEEANAGTVCAVTGITFTKPGDGLGFEKGAGLPVLEPVLTYRLNLPQEVDPHTALQKMRILEGEDPQLQVVWNERLSEIQVKLMGEIQLEILQSILRDRFGINATFGKGNIIYKETIGDVVEGVGHFEPLRHYAEVHLLLKPTDRDSGLLFTTNCKEDLLDKNWQRLILTHLYEKIHIGVLTGSPITDMEISLVAGKAHPKHTEGGDFRQATYRAVRQGLRSGKSILLEPIYEFTLEVPTENVGRAMADIQYMSGTFDSPEVQGEMSIITGTAPVSTMYDYSKDVVRYTHGKGKLLCSLKGYEPCHNSQEVIERIGYDADSDTDNSCDSIFCSHGAGYNVKWDEVKNKMHLSSVLSEPTKPTVGVRERLRNVKDKDSIFALDKELMAIFEQTYGPIKAKKTEEKKRHIDYTKQKEKSPGHIKTQDFKGTEYLLVDGYNVIFSWDELRELSKVTIDGARDKLINILCNYQGFKKCQVIVVFDAYKVKNNCGEVEKVNNIDVVYTKEAETADMYIEKVTQKIARNNKVKVVTSDAVEQLIILGNGALRVSSREFLSEVKEAEETIRQIISETY